MLKTFIGKTYLAAFLLLATPSTAQIIVFFGYDDNGTYRTALNKTVLSFFDVSTLDTLDGFGSSFGGGSSGTPGGTEYKLDRSKKIGIEYSYPVHLSETVTLKYAGSAFIGSSSYRFPNGVDIFTDPAVLRFKSIGIDVSGQISKRLNGAYFSYEPFTVVGLQTSHVSTTIKSALLDVRGAHFITSGYLGLGLKVTPRSTQHKIALKLEARGYTEQMLTLGLRAEYGF